MQSQSPPFRVRRADAPQTGPGVRLDRRRTVRAFAPTRMIVFALLALIALGGCSRTAVVLWTDVPEIVPAVESFNALQDEHVVELVYEPKIGRALRLAETPPDLVVGRFIEDQGTTELMQPLDRLVRRELDAEAFYRPLLESGSRGGRQKLLPVAFNLPLVYSAGEVRPVDTPMIITATEMQARGEQFNEVANERYTRIAYSPIWNPSFLYQYLRTQGFAVDEREDGRPVWSFETVVAGVAGAREWLALHGGVQADLAFQERYLYDPQIPLVRSGRVAYGYSTSDEYLELSDARREGLGFRWLGSEGSIPVLERVVYTGIPDGAEGRTGAERFLVYLFDVDSQSRLIASTIRKRVDVFGLAGGFSSLWWLNEAHLTTYYPELDGMIPPARRLAFPGPSPRHWGELTEEVVEPWLVREVMGTPQSRDLESSVGAWLLQQED
ncbi:MAG: hypothetical protein ACOC1U_04705 [Spirochaetota bacterium]